MKLRLTIIQTLRELQKDSQAKTGTEWVFMKDLFQKVKMKNKTLTITQFHHLLLGDLFSAIELERVSSVFAGTKRYGIMTDRGIMAMVRLKKTT